MKIYPIVILLVNKLNTLRGSQVRRISWVRGVRRSACWHLWPPRTMADIADRHLFSNHDTNSKTILNLLILIRGSSGQIYIKKPPENYRRFF